MLVREVDNFVSKTVQYHWITSCQKNNHIYRAKQPLLTFYVINKKDSQYPHPIPKYKGFFDTIKKRFWQMWDLK